MIMESDSTVPTKPEDTDAQGATSGNLMVNNIEYLKNI
jgi:hypothetical protein